VTLDALIADFQEEPGYLDFAAVGPLGAAVTAEGASLVELLSKARFGTIQNLLGQNERVREAVARVVGFPADSIVFQPNTSTGLLHAMFGLTGAVALSPAEYPSLTYAATRAAEALGVVSPVWLETDHGRVTPGNLREQLTDSTVAVAVSLVDFRTGFLADLDGIRQVIGDRLLIVDAIQGFGVVDAPYSVADVVVSGGQKWVRAGWGTGFLALSERAIEHLTPVWSGYTGTDADELTLDEVLPAARGARAFSVTNPDPIAEARLSTALDLIADAGVAAISARIAESVSRIIDLADEYAVPVVSPRDERERAGIVVLEPAPENLTVLTASLHNHGVSATIREGRVRLSAHVSTDEETFEILRASLLSYATATNI
jgi:selenocysteine lyase/cysteine desulfurase